MKRTGGASQARSNGRDDAIDRLYVGLEEVIGAQLPDQGWRGRLSGIAFLRFAQPGRGLRSLVP